MAEAGVGQHRQVGPPQFRQHLQRHPVEHGIFLPSAQRLAHQQAGNAVKHPFLPIMPQLGPVPLFCRRAADLKEQDGALQHVPGRFQTGVLEVGKYLEAPADERPPCRAALQRLITPVGHIDPPGARVGKGHLAIAVLGRRGNIAHRGVGEQHPADDPGGIIRHLHRLAEVIEHMRTVKAGDPRLHAEKVRGGAV